MRPVINSWGETIRMNLELSDIVVGQQYRANKYVDVTSLHIETGVSIEGCFLQTFNSVKKFYFPLNSHNSDTLFSIAVFATQDSSSVSFDSIMVGSTRVIDSGQPCYITIKYTKV